MATPQVMTGNGLEPVIGYAAPQLGDTICHYGQGTNGEACGKLKIVDSNGWFGINSPQAVGGDSGGPAYVYAKASTKKKSPIIGVLAVGVVEDNFYMNAEGKLDSGVAVAPISMVESELGVRLMVTNPSQ